MLYSNHQPPWYDINYYKMPHAINIIRHYSSNRHHLINILFDFNKTPGADHEIPKYNGWCVYTFKLLSTTFYQNNKSLISCCIQILIPQILFNMGIFKHQICMSIHPVHVRIYTCWQLFFDVKTIGECAGIPEASE